MAILTDEHEIMDKVKQYHNDGISSSANLYDRMRRAEDFKIGIQWDQAVKDSLEAKGKFALTIPLIKPTIKQVVGAEIQNPKELKVRPQIRGSAAIAGVLTSLSKHARDSEHAIYEQTAWFESGLTTAMGNILVSIEFDEDPKHGNMSIEKINEFEVLWDPNCKVYDPNSRRQGCKFVIWMPWEDKELVEKEYPDKKAELESTGTGSYSGGVAGTVNGFIDWLTGDRRRNISQFGGPEREDVTTIEKYRYQKMHTWWREEADGWMWYDERKSELDALLLIPGVDAEINGQKLRVTEKVITQLKQTAKANPQVFSLEKVVRPVMHHTISVNNVFLEDKIDELNGVTMFPIVPFYTYFDNGYKGGMSEDLIGTQEELNWAHSQKLNLIKKLASTGYKITKDITGKFSSWLKGHGGEDGVVIDESKAGGKVERLEPPNPNIGMIEIENSAQENFKRISNVRLEDPTTAKDRVATTVALKQQAAQVGSSPIMLNFDYSLSILNNLIVEIIRNNDIYSEDEIRAIIEEEDLIDKFFLDQARQQVIQQVQQAGQQIPEPPTPPDAATMQALPQDVQIATVTDYQADMMAYQQIQQQITQMAVPIAQKMMMDEIKNLKKGKYNTKVTLSRYAPTVRMAKSAEIFELNGVLLQNGQPPVDRKILVESTDVDQKEEIIAAGERQQQQAMAQNPNVNVSR